MEFYTEKHVVARKVHKCHICNHIIHVGEKYSRESGKFEGDFFDRCTCDSCYGIRQAYAVEDDSQLYDTYSLVDFVDSGFCSGCEYRLNCKGVFGCPRVRRHFGSNANEIWAKLDKK